jgi:hypothetical protein
VLDQTFVHWGSSSRSDAGSSLTMIQTTVSLVFISGSRGEETYASRYVIAIESCSGFWDNPRHATRDSERKSQELAGFHN